jgi:hypothetical protein
MSRGGQLETTLLIIIAALVVVACIILYIKLSALEKQVEKQVRESRQETVQFIQISLKQFAEMLTFRINDLLN